jgi:hypothetical protein
MIKVRIVIEQNDTAGATPISWTFEHRMGATGSNPRYVGDAVQLATIRAATDVCRHMAALVDLRQRTYQRGDVAEAAKDLLTAVSDVGE